MEKDIKNENDGRVTALENEYWGKRAAKAQKKGYLGREASSRFLKMMIKKKMISKLENRT